MPNDKTINDKTLKNHKTQENHVLRFTFCFHCCF